MNKFRRKADGYFLQFPKYYKTKNNPFGRIKDLVKYFMANCPLSSKEINECPKLFSVYCLSLNEDEKFGFNEQMNTKAKFQVLN